MKKFIFSFMAVIALSCAMSSCHNKTDESATANDTDTTVVDSDSVAVDSTVCND